MTSADDRHRENLRLWASQPLSCYGVADWDGQSGWSGSGGEESFGGGEMVVISQGVSHKRRDGSSIEVTSNRPDDDRFWQLRLSITRNIVLQAHDEASRTDRAEQAVRYAQISQFDQAAQDDRLAWQGVVIAVNGRPTIFAVAGFGTYWAAVGRGPDADLTLAGCGVAVPVALVRLAETAPPMKFMPPPPPPQPRARRFPDDSLEPVAMAEVGDHAKVKLTYRDGELSGTVAGLPVQLNVVIPAHEATASGTFAGADLRATWQLADNSTTHPDVPASLTGSFDGLPVALSAVFHLDDYYYTQGGTITGTIAGEPVDGRMELADGGIGQPGGTVYVEGAIAGAEFSLFASIATGYKALIRGQVSDRQIRLDAKAAPSVGSVRLGGSYQGPAALLVVIVVTVLHFI